jgi:hypothetical protein
MLCLTGARFTMQADVLRPEFETSDVDSPAEGTWDTYQDPITGAILRKWVPGTEATVDTPASSFRTVRCLARGIVDGGIRVAGTTERFGDTYENIDFVKMWVPSNIRLTKRDRITNIRKGSTVMWKDEESDNAATVFNINGVTPLFDAFNKHTEDFVLLEKAYGKN